MVHPASRRRFASRHCCELGRALPTYAKSWWRLAPTNCPKGFPFSQKPSLPRNSARRIPIRVVPPSMERFPFFIRDCTLYRYGASGDQSFGFLTSICWRIDFFSPEFRESLLDVRLITLPSASVRVVSTVTDSERVLLFWISVSTYTCALFSLILSKWTNTPPPPTVRESMASVMATGDLAIIHTSR